MADSIILSASIARMRFIDMTTGQLTREAVAFLTSVFYRLGGSNSPSVPEIEVQLETDAGTAEVQQLAQSIQQDLGQAPASDSASFLAFLSNLSELDQAPPGFVPAILVEDVLAQLQQTRELVVEMQKQIDGINQRVEL